MVLEAETLSECCRAEAHLRTPDWLAKLTAEASQWSQQRFYR